jgi:hexokinase
MSENTINGALRRLGFSGNEMTGHGFRAMARTILDEVLGYRIEWIEHQLAHAVPPVGAAICLVTDSHQYLIAPIAP